MDPVSPVSSHDQSAESMQDPEKGCDQSMSGSHVLRKKTTALSAAGLGGAKSVLRRCDPLRSSVCVSVWEVRSTNCRKWDI